MNGTGIFVNTKREAEFSTRLNANEFPCRVISGDVEQRKRANPSDFKDGNLPILIATDVASRGLHIEGVSHVINYDLPQDAEDYVHRIGRTARAGAEGKAISLVDEDGAFHLEAIEEYAKQKIPVEWADDDMYVHDYKRTRPKPKESAPSVKRKTAPGNRRVAKGRGARPKEGEPVNAFPAAELQPKPEGGEGKSRRNAAGHGERNLLERRRE
jgi:ATP-dependent RNA helicase RhlB